MKIVQISGFDTLGIQVNGYLLHEYYLNEGHDSIMFVHEKHSDDPRVFSLYSRWLRYLNVRMQKIGTALSLWSVFPIEGYRLLFSRRVRQADVLHLQLTYNAQFFSLFMIALISWLRWNKPTLVAIHDMFMTTGHCVYSMGCERWQSGCGKCPNKETPFAIRHDVTRLAWLIRRLVFGLARIHLIVGSPWQQRMLARSPILARKLSHYIPYGVDTSKYYIKDKRVCRERFGIPEDADVISFRSVPYGTNFKGTHFIIAALKDFVPRRKTYLLTFEGQGGLDALSGKFEIIQLPWTNNDQEMLSDALNAADIFLMPSVQEAFGLMAMEALACGTPVITFRGTALEETIDAPRCGIAVEMGNSAQLKDAIETLFNDDGLRYKMAENGLRLLERHHTLPIYAGRFLELYRRLSAKAS
ncbi:glycosyltransferase [Pannonibacter sp. Q-1]